jgi:hypothetical protein
MGPLLALSSDLSSFQPPLSSFSGIISGHPGQITLGQKEKKDIMIDTSLLNDLDLSPGWP